MEDLGPLPIKVYIWSTILFPTPINDWQKDLHQSAADQQWDLQSFKTALTDATQSHTET